MKWEIVTEKLDMSNVRLYIETDPPYDEIKYFFSQVELFKLPELIRNSCISKGFINPYYGVFFHSDLDGSDIASGNGFEENYVKVYEHRHGEVFLEEKQFDGILYDYATAILAAYADDDISDSDWNDEMKQAIESLKIKIDKYQGKFS
jgi:hypothetical protein